MSLIEQLGGYGETKKHIDSYWCDDNNKAYLLEKLLEYRRHHNIFEVGDLVTYKAYFKGVWCEGFGKITEIDEDLEVVNINENVGVAVSEIEHASDEDLIKLLLKLGRKKAELLLQQGNFISHDISKYLESINIIGGFGSISLAKKFLKDDGGSETIFGVEILRVKAAINDVENFIKIKKDFNCRDYWNT